MISKDRKRNQRQRERKVENGLNIKSVEANPHTEVYKVIENFISK